MFPDPRMPAKMQEAIEKLQQEAANAKREADKEEAIKILTQIMGAAFDKMSAYTSLIVIGGYAAFFSVWGVIEKFLPPWIKLTSFGFLTISILIFVLSETFRISTFTTEMQYFLRELRNATPAQIINRQ